MTVRIFRLWAIGLALLLQLAPAAHAADLTLERAGGYVIPVEINRQQLRLRVDIAASGYIILNPAAATRAGLEGSIVRSQTFVGPHKLRGGSNAARITIAGTQIRERVAFFDRDVAEGADGIISPELLPYDSVTFQIGAPQPGERVMQIPLAFTKSAGLFYRYGAGEAMMAIDFSPFREVSIATAAAGALLASQFGGGWSGEPGEQVISFQIKRPVREMTLERPLVVNGFDLRRFLVRTGDHRGNYTLPPDTPEDPGEIVVTAQRGSKQRPVHALTIGYDRLSSCSSLTYRKSGRLLTLNCAA